MVIIDTLNKGTVETISLDVTDRLGEITDLSAYNVEYRVWDENENELVAWTTVEAVNLMHIDILLDTTPNAFVDGMVLKIYVRINIAPEIPILGPFEVGLS